MAIPGRIVRITEPTAGTTHEDCFDPAKPLLIEMAPLDGSAHQVISICWDPSSTDPCAIVQQIREQGAFTVPDADGECPEA